MATLSTFLIHAFSRSTPEVEQKFNPATILKEARVSAPGQAVTTTEDYTVSLFSLRRLLYLYHDTSKRCPIRGQWDMAHTSSKTQETVSLNSIEGCLNSKSHITDFERMLTHPKSSANVRYHIDTYTDRVEELAEKVLQGSVDCAVSKDALAKIVRQGWDGKMWLSNGGGSHRCAAIWHIDRAHGHERLLPSIVETHDIAPHFRNLCGSHTLLMFRPQDPSALYDHKGAFQSSGLLLARQETTAIEPNPQDWCLIIPKSDQRHDAIKAMMTDAFDLSALVLNAYAQKDFAPRHALETATHPHL